MKKVNGLFWGTVLCLILLCGCTMNSQRDHTEEETMYITTEDADIEENESSEDSDKTQINEELIYQAIPLEIEIPMQVLDTMVSNGQQTYLYGWDVNTGAEYDMHCSIVRYGKGDMVGTTIHSVELKSDDLTCSSGQRMRPEKMAITPDGKLVAIFNVGTRMVPNQYELILFDLDGTELWRSTLEDTSVFFNAVVCTEEAIYVATKQEIVVFDHKGMMLQKLVIEVTEERQAVINLKSGLQKMYILEDGSVWLEFKRNGRRGAAFAEINVDTGEIVDWAYISGDYECFVGIGMDYDIILKSTEGIYGWNLGESEKKELINFEVSALLAENMDCVNCVDGGLLVRYRNMNDDVSVCLLKAMDPDSVVKKQIVTVGIFSVRGDYAREIARFNECSTEYLVRMVDYSRYADPVKQLNLDLVNGTAPDVIYYGNNSSEYELSLSNYARQGFLEDLKVWFERDPEFEEEEYLTNVFEALSINGGWYQLPTGFRVDAYLGHSDLFEQGQTMTLDQWEKLSEKNPEKTILYTSREALLRDTLIFRWTEFVNEESGTCDFDSEVFIELLEWLKQFPEVEGQFDDNMTRNGEIGALRQPLISFSEINTLLDKRFEQQSIFLFFPGTEKNGAIINTEGGVALAMLTQSDCKEGAWAFIRSFLQNEYQSTYAIGFPVKESALEEKGTKALDPYPEDYEPLFKIYPSYKLNGVSVRVEYPTQEKIDEWIMYLKSVTCADVLDNEICNIIVEESGAFFAGQKNAEEVAKIIQNRVWIYLAEQQ